MDDHPPVVHQAIAALQPASLIARIENLDDRVVLHLENGQALTYKTLHPPADPRPERSLSGALSLPKGLPKRAEGCGSVEEGVSLSLQGEGQAGGLASQPMYALRTIAADLGLTFTNKTTKLVLIELITAARSLTPSPFRERVGE